MKQDIQELKNEVDIVQLIDSYIPLKKRGKNFFGLSPFKQENTPSFCVNPQSQSYYCFATGKGGDCISFVEEIENLDFKGAVKFIVNKYNLSFSQFSNENQELKTR